MGRPKTVNIYERAKEFKADQFYVSDDSILMCGICNCRLEWEKKDGLTKHVSSSGHKKKKESSEQSATRKRQSTIPGMVTQQKKAKEDKQSFVHDTVKMCLKANIPLHKMDHPAVRTYLEKYVPGSGDLPTAHHLRRQYVTACGEDMKASVRDKIQNKKIVVIADETSDCKGRCVFAILFRTVTSTPSQEVFLVSCCFLDTANETTTSQAIMDCLKEYNVEYQNVVGLVSDSARYMGTCFNALSTMIGSHLLHLQCWAHKINLVGNVFMTEFKQLNQLVTKIKMAFLFSRKLKSAYKQFLIKKNPELAPNLFPSPVITRWNSWTHSVCYIDKYLDPLLAFFTSSETKNPSIVAILEMFEDSTTRQLIRAQCKYTSEVGEKLVNLIHVLEGSKYPYAHRLWDELLTLSALLKRNGEGYFPRCTMSLLNDIKNVTLKARVVADLKSTAQKGGAKLAKHMLPGPTNNFIKETGELFNPSIASQSQHVNEAKIKASKAKLPAFEEVDEDEFVDGYHYFHRHLLKNVQEEKSTDVVLLLLAMKTSYNNFASAALESVWAPMNSVDVERYFSQYNLVLSDRRTRMKEETIETCTMLVFNK